MLTGDEDLCQNDLDPTMDPENDTNEHLDSNEQQQVISKISKLKISNIKSRLGVATPIVEVPKKTPNSGGQAQKQKIIESDDRLHEFESICDQIGDELLEEKDKQINHSNHKIAVKSQY